MLRSVHLCHYVIVDEFGIRPLCPIPRGLILLAGKDGYSYRDIDALRVEKAALVLPIQTRRRDPRIRPPVERNIVKDLILRQFAGSTRGAAECCNDCCCRLAVMV